MSFDCSLRSQLSFVIFFKLPMQHIEKIFSEHSTYGKGNKLLMLQIEQAFKLKYMFIYMREDGPIFIKFERQIHV